MSDQSSKPASLLSRLWVSLLAWMIRKHIDKLLSTAHSEGQKVGRNLGYQQGHEQGQRIYRFEDARTPPDAKPIDAGLYGPERWIVSEAQREAMRREVAAAVAAEVIKEPTDEQWAMIFSDHPATCISAGAGSGKSTTLVLRVVFMIVHMGVPQRELTVISFTRASCEELRDALARVWGHWRAAPIPEVVIKRMVRTFHSVLLGLTYRPLPDAKFFERIKKSEVDEHASELTDEEQANVDNPMASSRLNERQAEHLIHAYRDLYATNEKFRKHVYHLLAWELSRASVYPEEQSFRTKTPGRFHFLRIQDAELTNVVSETWRDHGWPFPGVTDEPVPLFRFRGHKDPFYANGYVTETKMPVVLGFAPKLSKEQRGRKIDVPPATASSFSNALADRLKTIGTFCEKPYVMIRGNDDLELLKLRQSYIDVPEDARAKLPAPMFKIKIPGERKASMIYEAMFSQGSFIESMGVDVLDLLRKIPAFQFEGVEHHFCGALGYYWPRLAAALSSKGFLTYDRAFQTLTREAQTIDFDPVRLGELRNLLVDEFQDISPQIAFWLTAMQRRLLSLGPSKPLSIMAIGDDWQSIYGWRGSSPQLFIEFGRYFASHQNLGAEDPKLLTANYRSVAPIVEGAARLLVNVTSKVDKPSNPKVSLRSGDHGVQLSTYDPDGKTISKEQIHARLCEFITEQYQAALSMEGAKKEHLIVMTRRGKLRDTLNDRLGKLPGLRICTYHQAKGLEADVAILIEDCDPGDTHPLRNLLYRYSGVFRKDYTYDQAARDEAYRLAYVGVTRGRRRVFWKVQTIEKTVTAKCYEG